MMDKTRYLQPRRKSKTSRVVKNLLLYSLFLVLVAALTGCTLPIPGGEPTPIPQADALPAVSVGPLPPGLVETDPLPGSELSLNQEITFYFNQPMDRASVEEAMKGTPALNGTFTWQDDSILVFTPTQPWEPNSTLSITLNTLAKSDGGLTLQQPVTVEYPTTDYLRLNQMLPMQGTQEVAPESAIVVSFNEPVVALGAGDDLPPAFSLEPFADGQGEWLNTSTYVFYPEPALFGGTMYTVRVDPNLKSTGGTGLDSSGIWTFYTLEPGFTSYSPQKDALHVRLDEPVVVTFNQAMDTVSVEGAFTLIDENRQDIPGTFSWSEDFKQMTFTPNDLYQRGTRYTFSIPAGVLSRGGATLPDALTRNFYATMELFVLSTEPSSGGEKNQYSPVGIIFNAPIDTENPLDYISVEPEVRLRYEQNENELWLYGYFEAEQDYAITISGDLTDIWGDNLEFDFSFIFSGAPLLATFNPSVYQGRGAVFANPDQPLLSAQVVNVESVFVRNALISFTDFVNLQHTATYDDRQNYSPQNIKQTITTFEINRNRSQVVPIELNGGDGLLPGIYWVYLEPQPSPEYSYPVVTFAVISHVQMVYKASATNALVWAIDRRTSSPVANQQIVIYDSGGAILGAGMTDNTGLFTTELSPNTSQSSVTYAMLSNPGDEFFSLAKSDWNEGISSWEFGVSSNYSKPQTEYYLYTDRPIYRPGQEVAFKVVAREEYNGRYQLPADSIANISVRDYSGVEIDSITIPYSAYGTAEGRFTLPEFAEPGYYELVAQDEDYDRYVSFQVAEYRKPEIDIDLSLSKQDYMAGEQLSATVSSRYFFDVPASDVTLTWNLYTADARFSLPGYQVGPAGIFSYSPYDDFGGQLGNWLTGGEGTTGDDGSFTVTVPSELAEQIQNYTFEVILQDESGYPIAKRTSALVHPSLIYIGVKPDSWIGQAETEMNFDLLVVDWDKNPAGEQKLTAAFGEVTWTRGADDEFGFPAYEKQFKILAQGEFTTNQNGKARLPFTPAQPGVYQLEIRSGSAVTQVLFWVGGPGTGQWPNLNNNQITLLSAEESYSPGEVGSVFIPNPFKQTTLALVTTERGEIMNSQIVQVAGSGMNFPVQFSEEDAPNIYLTVTLLGNEEDGTLGFRYGMLNLPVDASVQQLRVEVLGQPERTGPGESILFTIQVTDVNGVPVQAEFSLAVVDQALLALADPFEEDIFTAFYDEQPLGVQTGISLVADAEIFLQLPPGLGGGGGGGDQLAGPVRSDFRDTAYWNGIIETSPEGIATVDVTLPDNLTTWQVLARGLTTDTRVGEAVSEVVTTQPLILRPVMPRFAVAGDHLEAAVVVQNNSNEDLDISLALKATGFTLDDPNASLMTIQLPAQSRVKVGWWGTVEQVEAIELVFTGEGGGYSDTTQPAQGSIPVVGYLALQTFATSGVLDVGGEQLELVSLPRSFEAEGGKLRLEMAPSLAGVALDGLNLIDDVPYETAEQTVTRFLPNLQMYLALEEFGLDTTELENRLDANLRSSINKLEANQNFDGGWSWYGRVGVESNPYVSAYVLLGLVKAEQAGHAVRTYVRDFAVQYLTEYLQANPPIDQQPWEYDRAAFIHFVLAQANAPAADLAYSLLDQKSALNPWGQALLGLTLLQFGETERVTSLFSDLQTGAVRAATGAYWEETGRYWQNMASDSFNNAVVLYALAQLDPASPLVADGVRYLMASRDTDGGWHSTYATSWALMAITEVMRGTGELGGDFGFSASLNDNPFAEGQAGGVQQFNQVVSETGLESLLPAMPNALTIQRDPGNGRLYYRAALNVIQPVETVAGLNKGIGISRVYYRQDADCRAADCEQVQSAQVGDLLTVRLTLNLPNNINYLAVEDYIPAGTEILNLDLKTSQLGEVEQSQQYLPEDPFRSGWGWWYFDNPQVYDDHISWVAEYLPAGTYELTYTLVVLQSGSYRVIPAQAHQIYFPEVQGVSAGIVFEIQ
jgi:uncharacterized protein YfaS (alpha-2-macroglobulin family)